MPFVSRLFDGRRLAIVAVTGRVSGPDLVRAMHEVFEREDWAPGFDIIWDARTIEELVISPEDAASIIEATRVLASRMGNGRSALIVARFLDYAAARMLASRNVAAPGREVRVFETAEEAGDWLGVPVALLNGE